MSNLLDFVNSQPEREYCVAVVGDAMIDQYYDVSVKGVSPEFPIPVMACADDKPIERPGGAANVAYQFSHFPYDARLISVLDDEARASIDRCGVDTSMSIQMCGRNPRKKRLYSSGFPLCRFDLEAPDYGLDPESMASVSADAWEALEAVDFNAVVFSDYGKGLLAKVRNESLRRFPISIVDPKLGDIRRWRGCTIFKPNESEALRLSGQPTVSEAGLALVSMLDCNVVVTRAGKGVSVFRPGEPEAFVGRPSSQAQVESVIGAGDCFVAFMTMALCRGYDICSAVAVAYEAGSMYVRNKHNQPLSAAHIRRSLDPCSCKLVEGDIQEFFSNRDYRLVFTNGCFDFLHPGHVQSLRVAKSHGDRLVVAVNTDESVSRLKPGRPLQNLHERIAMLAACEHVDYVVVFDEDSPEKVIRQIMPDAVAKGDEYAESSIVGSGIVPEIIRVPMLPNYSTTRLLDRIRRSL